MQPRDPHHIRPARTVLGRLVWSGLGVSCVAVGAIGIVVPGLPTTPFFVLAAACFVRSSQRLYDKLLAHRTFGPLVRDYREGRGVPRKAKIWAIGTMWVFVLFALGLGLPPGQLVLRIIVGSAAVIGTTYLLRLPTRAPDDRGDVDHDGGDGSR